MNGDHLNGQYLESRCSCRQKIFNAWKHRCCYCGEWADTLDHLVPKSHGGTQTMGNLAPACQQCNQSKSDRDLEVWYRSRNFFDSDRFWFIQEWQREPWG